MTRMLKPSMLENVEEHPVGADFFTRREKKELPVNNTHLISVNRPSLPIILVPGIMASRLWDTKAEGIVWDPDGGRKTLNQFSGLSSKERYEILAAQKEFLVPMNFDADFKDATHCKKNFAKQYPHGEKRGWGGVYWGGYGDLLKALDDWDTPLKLLVDLPVYAFGYNWMEDNAQSGEKLAAAISVVQGWHAAMHVLLVTHSMGGLVARSACKQKNAEGRVYGVIHGAQPVLGAPDTYRRMIAGEMGDSFMNSIMAGIIGPDGPCITAVLAHNIAGLELLPSRHYSLSPAVTISENEADPNQWLHLVTVHDDGTTKTAHYPKDGDPFLEIYRKGVRGKADSLELGSEEKVFWRLLREEWIQPVLTNPKTQQDEINTEAVAQVQENIDEAEQFQEDLNNDGPYCHPRTVQLYSADDQSDTEHVRSGNRTFCEIIWETREKTARVKKLCREVDKDWDYVDRMDFPIQEFHAQSNQKGKYQELILLGKNDNLTDSTPCYTGMVTRHLFRPGGAIYETQKNGGRIFVRRLLGRDKKVAEVPIYPRTENGDTTVPDFSAQGLSPSLDAWPKECHYYLASPSTGKKVATFRPNKAGHADFFDKNAILATKNALHNLILAWISEHGNQPGEKFDCALNCLKNADKEEKTKELQDERSSNTRR